MSTDGAREALGFADAPHDRGNVGNPRLVGRLATRSQLQHEVIHPSYDVFDGGEHVPLELRIVPVALGVLQHERKL